MRTKRADHLGFELTGEANGSITDPPSMHTPRAGGMTQKHTFMKAMRLSTKIRKVRSVDNVSQGQVVPQR